MSALISISNSNFWIIDSGATDHMTNQKNNLHNFKAPAETQSVSVANGMNVQVMGQGRITFFNSKTDSAALYVPSFPFQLMSVGRVTNSLNCNVIFSPHDVIFQDRVTLKTIGRGHYLNGLYILHQMPSKSTTGVFQASSYPNGVLWHQRLGHPSDIVLSNMFSSLNNASHGCEVCRFSKQTRLSFSSSVTQKSRPFELVHSDVWGPAPLESHDGFKYFVIFVDDYSRATWLYLLKSTSEVASIFQDFHKLVMNQFDSQIKVLRTDNGTEFVNSSMTQYLSSYGIMHQTSCVGTPQQNGIAERKNRDLLEKTRSIMLNMNVPNFFLVTWCSYSSISNQ